jgi:hypothetical protein
MGVGVSSVVGAIDIATSDVSINRPVVGPLDLNDTSRLAVEVGAVAADLLKRGGSELGAIAFYSNTPLVMKTVRKLAGI